MAERDSSKYYTSDNTSTVAISNAGFVSRDAVSGRMTFQESAAHESIDLGYSISTTENHTILSCVLSNFGVFVMHESNGRLTRLGRGTAPSFLQTDETAETTRISACSYGSSIIIGAGKFVILRTLMSSMIVDFDANTIKPIDIGDRSIVTYLSENTLVEFDPAITTVTELDVVTGTKMSKKLIVPVELNAYSWTMALGFGTRRRVAVVARMPCDTTAVTDTVVIVYNYHYECIGAIRIACIADIADTFNETLAVMTFYGEFVQIDTNTMVSKTISRISDILVAPKNNYAASTVLSVIGRDLVVYASTLGLGLGKDTCGLYRVFPGGFCGGALEEQQ